MIQPKRLLCISALTAVALLFAAAVFQENVAQQIERNPSPGPDGAMRAEGAGEARAGLSGEEESDARSAALSAGGEFSHLWSVSGKVNSISEDTLVLKTEDGLILAVDTTRAKQQWHYPIEVNAGDDVVVWYFLYERDGDEIVADSVEHQSRAAG